MILKRFLGTEREKKKVELVELAKRKAHVGQRRGFECLTDAWLLPEV